MELIPKTISLQFYVLWRNIEAKKLKLDPQMTNVFLCKILKNEPFKTRAQLNDFTILYMD